MRLVLFTAVIVAVLACLKSLQQQAELERQQEELAMLLSGELQLIEQSTDGQFTNVGAVEVKWKLYQNQNTAEKE